MAGIGPLEFVVVAFPGEELPDRVGSVLRAVERGGDVRIVDALAVTKDRDGRVRSAELGDVAVLAGDVAALAGPAGGYDVAGAGLISVADIDEVGQALDVGSAGLALLIEHAWARETAAVVHALGGLLVAAVRIPETYVTEARRAHEAPGHTR